MGNCIKEHIDRMKQLDLSIIDDNVSDGDASLIIENVLDTLVEVGNGSTENDLHKAADYLFAFRDKWLYKQLNKK